jgi:hypothetical protein
MLLSSVLTSFLRNSRFSLFQFTGVFFFFFPAESKCVFGPGRSPLFNIICKRVVKNSLLAGENLF